LKVNRPGSRVGLRTRLARGFETEPRDLKVGRVGFETWTGSAGLESRPLRNLDRPQLGIPTGQVSRSGFESGRPVRRPSHGFETQLRPQWPAFGTPWPVRFEIPSWSVTFQTCPELVIIIFLQSGSKHAPAKLQSRSTVGFQTWLRWSTRVGFKVNRLPVGQVLNRSSLSPNQRRNRRFETQPHTGWV
jgi:hypothetical protein